MKAFLSILCSLALSLSLRAQSTSGDIVATDATASTVSVSVGGETPKVYRSRASVEIVVNGVRAKFADLGVGMSVKVTSGEPGFATRLEATGTGTGAAILDKAALEQKLIGTTWSWNESKDFQETLTFKSGGVARLSSRPRPFQWVAAPGGNRVEGLTQMGKKFRITFDGTLTHGRVYEAEINPRPTKLITP